MQERTLAVRFWGHGALWSIPHFMGEPHSLPCPTPSATDRMMGSLYGKPEFEYETRRIHFYKPIRYDNIQQRSVITKSAVTDRTLQTYTALVDVEYIVEVVIRTNPLRRHSEVAENRGHIRGDGEYFGIARDRFRRKREFRQPFLGKSRFPASWELVEGEIPQPLPINMDIGPIPFNKLPLDIDKDQYEERFFHARITNGTLHVPETLYTERFREARFTQRHRVSGGNRAS